MRFVIAFDGTRCATSCVWGMHHAISSLSCNLQPAPLLARPQIRQTALVRLHHW